MRWIGGSNSLVATWTPRVNDDATAGSPTHSSNYPSLNHEVNLLVCFCQQTWEWLSLAGRLAWTKGDDGVQSETGYQRRKEIQRWTAVRANDHIWPELASKNGMSGSTGGRSHTLHQIFIHTPSAPLSAMNPKIIRSRIRPNLIRTKKQALWCMKHLVPISPGIPEDLPVQQEVRDKWGSSVCIFHETLNLTSELVAAYKRSQGKNKNHQSPEDRSSHPLLLQHTWLLLTSGSFKFENTTRRHHLSVACQFPWMSMIHEWMSVCVNASVGLGGIYWQQLYLKV